MLTIYHARHKAIELQQKGRKDFRKLLPALASAQIDLHPHQIEAALFAWQAPFSEGVILADEEGLGKTISAGLVLLEAVIEDKKNLLVLCPQNLITYWKNELKNKFDIEDGITILSYQEAAKQAGILAETPWDLCVLDEAHLLASANLSDKGMAETIQKALKGRRKLLLTATPMQNSPLDLYYLIKLVDDKAFGGGAELFKKKYMENKALKAELAQRAQQLCQRTLKRHTLTMQLPKRDVKTILVSPSEAEIKLSKQMSLYFHREKMVAFPKIQEPYIRLTFWKLLASSTQALATSLEKIIKRIESDQAAEDEVKELLALVKMAEKIKSPARSEAFLKTLTEALVKLKQAGAPEKALIFSENKTTLAFLHALLKKNGYKVVLSAPDTVEEDIKKFKTKADILLSTDHLGKGLDISFCACVINYDVPWNVQKLEQRISRCHRYGQKHDVLVINFIDPTNRADKRLYTVLNKKLQKFDEVFGASETVLGELTTTLDTDLRTTDEIEKEFEKFTTEHKDEIDTAIATAESDLLAHFDETVVEKFKFYAEKIPEQIKAMEDDLWKLSKYAMGTSVVFDDEQRKIIIDRPPFKGLRLSRMSYRMGADVPRGERYTFSSPLAKAALYSLVEGDLLPGL